MRVRRLVTVFAILFLFTLGRMPGASAQPADGYLVVLSAFEPELTRLLDQADVHNVTPIDGRRYHLGTLAGNAVILVLTGIGLERAERTTRAVLDAFPVAGVVFSGIAGGINPDLHIGDVTIPTRWIQHDVDAARTPVWYPVDVVMLEVARRVADSVALADCTAEGICLNRKPVVVPGGNGVSGRRFVSDAGLRQWIWETFEADVVDMETVAVARVVHERQVPFLAFRSLSDLAAGGAGHEFDTFFQLAADNAAAVVVAFLEAWARRRAEAVSVVDDGFSAGFRVDQNYPNPFRDRTVMSFTLPTSRFVTLEVYDVLGKKVDTVAARPFTAGQHRVVWDAIDVPSGVYLCRFQAGSFTQSRRLILLR